MHSQIRTKSRDHGNHHEITRFSTYCRGYFQPFGEEKSTGMSYGGQIMEENYGSTWILVEETTSP